jgi:hypothetical protein
MLRFHHFYNVRINDPEEMGFDWPFDLHAGYHFSYFKQMANENKSTYSKNNPLVVCQDNFIQDLIKRTDDTNHIRTFKILFDELNRLRNKLL